ncbi:MAG TPA: right-handed parallel beta-helix repeat-containing protein [Gemmatimonadaceae bacterium]|nr:right-handed parallel beta-helix repeat-containing protein [Gemmatimonadaceae bacterium]
MIRFVSVALLLCATIASAQQRALSPIELKAGLVITQSARVASRVYELPPIAPADSPIIVIRGNDITVDFAGATLEGTPLDSNPDLARGTAILVDGGRNVRILNARVHGYKVGILARGTVNLSLIDNDLSYNWKPRLFSVIEHESLIDWLSFHHNEKDEWLRYGAGAYLNGVEGGEIRGNTVRQGMNGLMLVRSNALRVWNNDFSFNSGVGIGLYRSTGNSIMHNRVDYNVRGYSEGFYRRGQDAADLLMYEQSNKNVVAYNSMTHGGDGVFLWAGQSTMDTGEGGANDNLFYGNDFSFAPANGIEATFSRNVFVKNRVEGSEYGAWAGYSFDSKFVGNDFRQNRTGIAIEHGQNNLIASNVFAGDSTAIRVWADSIEPSDWGYPKHRDTRSKDYEINDNLFVGNRVGIRAASTMGLTVANNQFIGVDSTAAILDSTGYTFIRNAVRERPPSSSPRLPKLPAEFAKLAPKPIARGWMPSRSDTALSRRPRSAIIVDDWGPYDYRSPKLWPVDSAHELPLRLRSLGPPGRWRVIEQRGITPLSKTEGRIGDTIVVIAKPDSIHNWKLSLEYTGAAVTSPRGERYERGEPYTFSYERFEPHIEWAVRFYRWTDSIADLRKGAERFAELLKNVPLATGRVSRLDYEGYRALPGIPRENFALAATGSIDLPPGEFTLRTISDDGIRVWVDDKLMIQNWAPHESALDYAPLSGGHHELRVEYYQADGWYELRLDILRGRDRSEGSPAPHGA